MERIRDESIRWTAGVRCFREKKAKRGSDSESEGCQSWSWHPGGLTEELKEVKKGDEVGWL